MEKIILYSTHCPKCETLQRKLNTKNIKYTEVNDLETMRNLGIKVVPVLAVNEELLPFGEAVKWINQKED